MSRIYVQTLFNPFLIPSPKAISLIHPYSTHLAGHSRFLFEDLIGQISPRRWSQNNFIKPL